VIAGKTVFIPWLIRLEFYKLGIAKLIIGTNEQTKGKTCQVHLRILNVRMDDVNLTGLSLSQQLL